MHCVEEVSGDTWVALRKESVDRNSEDWLNAGSLSRSLSARRAWIEIIIRRCSIWVLQVALRKESVDRNKYVVQCRKVMGVSLSARRAWIEILFYGSDLVYSDGRSPQGERG